LVIEAIGLRGRHVVLNPGVPERAERDRVVPGDLIEEVGRGHPPVLKVVVAPPGIRRPVELGVGEGRGGLDGADCLADDFGTGAVAFDDDEVERPGHGAPSRRRVNFVIFRLSSTNNVIKFVIMRWGSSDKSSIYARRSQMGSGLRGNYHVKPTPSTIRDAMGLFPKYGDYQEARRHAKKLMFWPSGEDQDSGRVVDLDWEWVKALKGTRTGELRIDDVIGGHNNLRVIFHVADEVLSGDPLPKIWIIAVLQKKSNHFTANDIATFRGRLTILKKRYYSG
jgi:hypothetical protein